MANRVFPDKEGLFEIIVDQNAYRELLMYGMLHEGERLEDGQYRLKIERDVYETLAGHQLPDETMSDVIRRCIRQKGGTN